MQQLTGRDIPDLRQSVSAPGREQLSVRRQGGRMDSDAAVRADFGDHLSRRDVPHSDQSLRSTGGGQSLSITRNVQKDDVLLMIGEKAFHPSRTEIDYGDLTVNRPDKNPFAVSRKISLEPESRMWR